MSFARLSQRLSGKTVVSANVFQEKLYISFILLCSRCLHQYGDHKQNLKPPAAKYNRTLRSLHNAIELQLLLRPAGQR